MQILMREICISFIALCLFFSSVCAQKTESMLTLLPDSAYDNIKIHLLASNKQSTSFVIWIKKDVRAHLHEQHTENIYVLEGEGEMRIGNGTQKIKPGDFLNIPPGIPHSLKVTSATPVKVLSIQSPEFLGNDRVFVNE